MKKEYRRQNENLKTNHESTLRHRSGQAKIGKHEKMPEVKKEESRIQ